MVVQHPLRITLDQSNRAWIVWLVLITACVVSAVCGWEIHARPAEIMLTYEC